MVPHHHRKILCNASSWKCVERHVIASAVVMLLGVCGIVRSVGAEWQDMVTIVCEDRS